MSQPSEAIPSPNPVIMKRLGYIKLLHDQAIGQSYLPSPLNFASVLAMHDVLEYFIILAVQHVDPSIDLKQPLRENVKKLKAPDGKPLSCRDGLERITVDRNAFKHQGNIPGLEQIESARHDTQRFLDANCPRFFGVDYSDVSMLHIVPQTEVLDELKLGRAAVDDLRKAMEHVAFAFFRLIDAWGRGKRLYMSRPGRSFALADSEDHRRSPNMRVWLTPRDSNTKGAFEALTSTVKRQFEEVDKEIASLRQVIRIQMAGLDTARYIRFAMLAPAVSYDFEGELEAQHLGGQYHYTEENYAFCESFVIDSALRLAESDFSLWTPETFGDAARADEAMKENGGTIPEGWS